MSDMSIRLVTSSGGLPQMQCHNFFHSVGFFKILEETAGMSPCMAVVQDKAGRVVAHMLAVINNRRTFLPPFFFRFGHVYGEGEYAAGSDVKLLFARMLALVTAKFRRSMCLYYEFSELSSKMFGYRAFKQNGYFPVPWQEVHNSLHSMLPAQRLGPRMQRLITISEQRGVSTGPASCDADVKAYVSLLRKHFMLKTRRHIPHSSLFGRITASGNGVNLITKHKGKVIGGCTLVFSGCNAYMWFLASRRKTCHHLYPAEACVWGALSYAHANGYDHLFFLDAGLPLKSSPYRDFVLSFGGKPVAKYHWFRLPVPCLNRLLSWAYNE